MKIIAQLLFCFILLLHVSCKVSLSGASIPPDAKTISVAVFPNNAPLVQPSLSQAFTEELRNIFLSQTTLALIDRGGDLHFEGAITDYRINPIAIQEQTASNNRLTISVSVSFINKKDPEKDFESTFTRYVDFSAAQNLIAVENQLIKEVNLQLVQDIFNKAVINW